MIILVGELRFGQFLSIVRDFYGESKLDGAIAS